MPLNAESPDHRHTSPLTGRGVLLWIGGFFFSIFFANFALTYFALHTLPGGVLENSWDASQNWNQRLAAARAQTQRGWSAQASLRAEGVGARVHFAPLDRDGAFVSGLLVEAVLEHPSDRRADRSETLLQQGSEYQGFISDAPNGEWTLQIKAILDGELLYETRNHVTLRRGPAAESRP
jgi:nitrogen fixation protein FixH